MSISYPLEFPLGRNFRTARLSEANAVSRTTSPFSFREQLYSYDADRWLLEVSFPPLTADQARDIQAFISSLRGGIGTFNFYDPFMSEPRGVASGTPLVKGANQSGYSCVTDGWSNSVTGILKAGDYINIGTGFHRVLKDANSNGSGEATLDIWPSLRGPADDAPIVVTQAKGKFRLASSTSSSFFSADGDYEISFAAVEAI